MTSLLPPNLLRLFAPRPLPPFLKPLTRDEINRGPNRIAGCGELVQRIREEAEEAELQEGLGDRPETKSERIGINGVGETKKTKEDPAANEETGADGMDVDRPETNGTSDAKGKGKAKPKPVRKQRKDKFSEMGIVGQEAVVLRRQERVKRKEQYKKDLEKNCQLSSSSLIRELIMMISDLPQEDENAAGDPYKTLFISRLVSCRPS